MKKLITTGIVSILLVTLIAFPAQASGIESLENQNRETITQAAAASGDAVMPLADTIVIKTRTYNGKKQYRRWNATKGYWVDPYWIDCI